MGRNRFLVPETDTIPLTDGDWIRVKMDLDNGDTKKLECCGQKPPVSVDGKIIFPIDWEVYEMERALIYLTEWSFADAQGNQTKPSMATLKALNPDDFKELELAIYEHIAKRKAAKNGSRGGQTAAESPTPQSPNSAEASAEAPST